MKYYTLGEIFRLGLLKGFDGKPYKHKATVSRIVRGAKFKNVKTRFGMAKGLTIQQIEKLNKRW